MSRNVLDTPEARFHVGDTVVVADRPPEVHCRTPSYLRGARGRVVERVGRYPNPALLAFHKPGLPKIWLYRVCFDQATLWSDYRGAPGDTVMADLYEHWLLPVQEHSNVTV